MVDGLIGACTVIVVLHASGAHKEGVENAIHRHQIREDLHV